MKKFLILFIVGVVLVAIGATSLVFELSSFEYVHTTELSNGVKGSTTKNIKLKPNTDAMITYVDVATSFEWHYNDQLHNEVKITIPNGTNYQLQGQKLTIYDDGLSIDETYGFSAFQKHLAFFMEGLKKHKIYSMDSPQIQITTSHADRDRVHLQYAEDDDE